MKATLEKILIAACLFVSALVLFNSPGTGDVAVFQGWIANAVEYGVVDGFAANAMDYPPLSTLLLRAAHLFFEGSEAGTFYAVKAAVFFFLVLGCAAVYLYRKSIADASLFFAAFLVSSLGLGYTDVMPVALVMFALLALRDGRLAVFSLLFSLACYMKWQPVILLPLCFMYAVNNERCLTTADRASGLLKMAAPLAAISLGVVALYGWTPVFSAFASAASHSALSANALNLNWLLTWAVRMFSPELHGPLENGVVSIIWTPGPALKFGKALFFVIYGAASFVFMSRKRGFEEFLYFCVAVFFAYYTFNTGVHENHLAIPAAFAVALYIADPSRLFVAVAVVFAFNVNMLVFYGISGRSAAGRTLFGLFDATLPAAALNVILCLFLLYGVAAAYGRKKQAP